MKIAVFAAAGAALAAAAHHTNHTSTTNATNATNATALHSVVFPALNATKNATNSTNSTNSTKDAINFAKVHDRAPTQSTFLNLDKGDIVTIGAGFVGSMLVVAGAAVAINKRGKAAAANADKDASVLAEDAVEEIEAAENAAEAAKEDEAAPPASPADKEEDIQDVSTDSPSVVSV
ncbi:hypothetical protein LEN26_014921 [Aphanomyces euteiches]|nr:hypothetical protein LEN26_014921 [Aphanomyces euteiches]